VSPTPTGRMSESVERPSRRGSSESSAAPACAWATTRAISHAQAHTHTQAMEKVTRSLKNLYNGIAKHLRLGRQARTELAY